MFCLDELDLQNHLGVDSKEKYVALNETFCLSGFPLLE